MSKLIVDAEKGTETIVEFTADEQKAFDKSTKETAEIVAEQEKALAAKEALRKVILEKLGLNSDEIAILLG